MSNKRRRVTRQSVAQGAHDKEPVFQSLPVVTRRGQPRGPEWLTKMPVDIVFEITRFLAPIDLLHLTRTNKTFRRFLLSRSSEPVWQFSRQSFERLPDCPEHMSEPAYASLVFENYCYRCGKTGVKTALWAFSARYCPACKSKMLVKCKDECMYGDTCDDALIPHMHDRSTAAHYHHLSDADWLELKSGKLTEAERQAHKLETRKRMNHAADCEDWQLYLAEERRKQQDEERRRGVDEIEERLRALGYGEDLDTLVATTHYGETVHAMLYTIADLYWRRSEKLTDKVWEGIKARFVRFAEDLRDERLEDERFALLSRRCHIFVDLYRGWWAEQEDRNVLPHWGEILRRDELWEILDQPNGVEVTLDDFQPLRQYFAAWAEEWRQERDGDLREVVLNSPQFKDKVPEGVDPLSLAAVVFDCANCFNRSPKRNMLPPQYPAIMSHECLYTSDWEIDDDVYERALRSIKPGGWDGYGYGSWNTRMLHIDVLHRRVVEVIIACGKDPMTTTQEEMDLLDVRFWCEVCDESTKGQSREVMRWRDTVMHTIVHDRRNGFSHPVDYARSYRLIQYPIRWSVMSGAIVDEVKKYEIAAQPKFDQQEKLSETSEWFWCNHCEEGMISFPELEGHLADAHDIAEADIHPRDYHRTADADLVRTRPIVLLKPRSLDALSAEEMKLMDEGKAYFCDF